MKSLFIVNDFPPDFGGQSTYYLNLCKALPKDQFIVLAPKLHGSETIDNDLNFKVIRKPYSIKIPIIQTFLK